MRRLTLLLLCTPLLLAAKPTPAPTATLVVSPSPVTAGACATASGDNYVPSRPIQWQVYDGSGAIVDGQLGMADSSGHIAIACVQTFRPGTYRLEVYQDTSKHGGRSPSTLMASTTFPVI